MNTIIAVIPHYHFKLLVQDFKSETVSEFFDAMNSTDTDFNGYVAMPTPLSQRSPSPYYQHERNQSIQPNQQLIFWKPSQSSAYGLFIILISP